MASIASRLVVVALLVGLPAAMPRIGHAWSAKGHKVVCEIALRELTAAERQKIKALLAHDEPEFQSFPAACTWPDVDKHSEGSVQNQRRSDHYINVARDLPAITSNSCGEAPSCLFTAIARDAKALQPGSGKDRAQALKFLGHWIGDLHQPLHVSFEDDSGGNDISTPKGSDCASLHSVWDECIPDDLMKLLGVGTAVKMGDKLQAEIAADQRAKWRAGSPLEWAAESYAIARQPDVKYCSLTSQPGKCCYSATKCEHQGKRRILAKLGESYDEDHVQVVREQLQKAGVRLAMMLRRSLAPH